jgi:hypothetical protein
MLRGIAACCGRDARLPAAAGALAVLRPSACAGRPERLEERREVFAFAIVIPALQA